MCLQTVKIGQKSSKDSFEYVDVSSTDKYKYIRIDVHNNTGGTYNSLTEIKVYRGDSK